MACLLPLAMIGGHPYPCESGTVRGAADPESAAVSKGWILAASILGSSMAFIEGSVVNVALPAIQRSLAASASDMQWVLNAYLLFLGSLILVGGSAGDRFGRRKVFAIGILVFTGAAIGCGLAPSAGLLVLLRSVQGVGGALLVPSSLALLSASFDREERGGAIGTWAGFSALTTAVGPVLGGALVDAGSWRAAFFVVVPVALLALAITLMRVPESRSREKGSIDGRGALLVTAGLGAGTFGVISSSGIGLGAPPVLLALAASFVLLALFVRAEWRADSPMLPLDLFRSPSFTGANLLTLCLYFALNGALFFLPFNLVQVQGYSATAAGAAFLPFTLVMGTLSRWAGSFADRHGARRPLVVGPVVAGIGFALLALPGSEGSYWTTFFPGMLVLGFGMTVSVAPLTTVVINAVPEERAGTASGVNNAAARVAGLLGVALLGAVAIAIFGSSLERRLQAIEAPPAAKQSLVESSEDLAAVRIPEGIDPETRRAFESGVASSFITSFRWVMVLSAATAVLGAFFALLLVETSRPERASGPVREES